MSSLNSAGTPRALNRGFAGSQSAGNLRQSLVELRATAASRSASSSELTRLDPSTLEPEVARRIVAELVSDAKAALEAGDPSRAGRALEEAEYVAERAEVETPEEVAPLFKQAHEGEMRRKLSAAEVAHTEGQRGRFERLFDAAMRNRAQAGVSIPPSFEALELHRDINALEADVQKGA